MIYISCMTLHELKFGTERLCLRKRIDDQIRGARIAQANDLILHKLFDDHILSVEASLLVRAGTIRAAAEHVCGDIGLADAVLAATAEFYNLTVVTNNLRHFRAAGAKVVDSQSLYRPDNSLRLVL